MVEKYMTMIIREVLANQRGVNPVEVKDEEVMEAYKNDSLEKYKIKEVEVKYYVNGKEEHVVVCGLVDRNTGYEYNSNVIKIK